MRLIYDDEVRARLKFSVAIAEIERVLEARTKGAFHAPARHYEGNEVGDLAFTIGGDAREGAFGFRVYPRFRGAGPDSQFTAVWNAATGVLEGLVFGDYLGAARTGAIGAVAIKRLAPQHVSTLALIGTGLQAETQLRAATEVRDFETVKVFSPTKEHRDEFCARMTETLSATVQPASSPEEALDGAQVAITATSAKAALCDAAAFKSVLHINAIGPKFTRANELPEALYGMMDTMATDSLDQLAGYDTPPSLREAPAYASLQDLGAFTKWQRGATTKSLFLSVGLAGTEPCVARTLF